MRFQSEVHILPIAPVGFFDSVETILKMVNYGQFKDDNGGKAHLTMDQNGHEFHLYVGMVRLNFAGNAITGVKVDIVSPRFATMDEVRRTSCWAAHSNAEIKIRNIFRHHAGYWGAYINENGAASLVKFEDGRVVVTYPEDREDT